jgi:hypothetical protein
MLTTLPGATVFPRSCARPLTTSIVRCSNAYDIREWRGPG